MIRSTMRQLYRVLVGCGIVLLMVLACAATNAPVQAQTGQPKFQAAPGIASQSADFFISPLLSNQEHLAIPAIFAQRPAGSLTPWNVMAYALQHTYTAGVPIDSILLILSIPIIATVVAFFRYVIGFPTLGIVLTMVLSLTFISIGILLSVFLLGTLVVATVVTRILLRRIRIMQFAKVALSMLLISCAILATFVASLRVGIVTSSQISIFPVLLFLLLSERIVALQLERSLRDAMMITVMTLLLGVVGYGIFSTPFIRNTLLLYPEFLILLIPLNIMIGRYYGLRLTEYFRFMPHMRHAIK